MFFFWPLPLDPALTLLCVFHLLLSEVFNIQIPAFFFLLFNNSNTEPVAKKCDRGTTALTTLMHSSKNILQEEVAVRKYAALIPLIKNKILLNYKN